MQLHRFPTWRAVLPLLLVALAGAHLTAAESEAAGRELGRIESTQLDEVSGIAASRQNPGILWMHNDGDVQHVFAVTTSGRVVARVRLLAPIRDAEDIAIGPGPTPGVDYLYLGDIGDNDNRRDTVRILRFAEPDLRTARGGELVATQTEEFLLTYPDRQRNAEALLVDPATGDVLIATKEKNRARLYVAPADQLRDKSTTALTRAGNVDVEYISGGDISADATRIILRRETRGWLWDRRGDESVATALQRAPQQIPVKAAGQGQNGESVAFVPDGSGYYTISEGRRQAICVFPLEPAVSD